MEKDGRLSEAAETFASAARRHPKADWAPEALLAAGRLWSKLNQCDRAVPALEDAAKLYGGPWREKAESALLDCPDFVPLVAGRAWTLGDSDTHGDDMRQEFKVLDAADGEGQVEVRTFAGNKLFSTVRRRIKKADWRIEENDKSGEPTVILRYPYDKGATWTSKRGAKLVRFEIEDASATVKTAAGTFTGCLKVREQVEGLPSWTYTYYAPGVGRVLTTVAGRGFETRNAELLSDKAGDTAKAMSPAK